MTIVVFLGKLEDMTCIDWHGVAVVTIGFILSLPSARWVATKVLEDD